MNPESQQKVVHELSHWFCMTFGRSAADLGYRASCRKMHAFGKKAVDFAMRNMPEGHRERQEGDKERQSKRGANNTLLCVSVLCGLRADLHQVRPAGQGQHRIWTPRAEDHKGP